MNEWLKANAIPLVLILLSATGLYINMQISMSEFQGSLDNLNQQVLILADKLVKVDEDTISNTHRSLNNYTWARESIERQELQWIRQQEVNEKLLSTMHNLDKTLSTLKAQMATSGTN